MKTQQDDCVSIVKKEQEWNKKKHFGFSLSLAKGAQPVQVQKISSRSNSYINLF